jgi:hypothetical protein
MQNAWSYDPADTASFETRTGLAILPKGIQWRVRTAVHLKGSVMTQ